MDTMTEPLAQGKRGNIWIASAAPHYASNPRPFVVVQDDAFEHTESVAICPFTTAGLEMPLFRLLVEPNELNGLGRRASSWWTR
jgi:mRNA interferase MazF